MQEAIGHELRARFESQLELPGDLRGLVKKIEPHEQIANSAGKS
jgi:hypothetical protein